MLKRFLNLMREKLRHCGSGPGSVRVRQMTMKSNIEARVRPSSDLKSAVNNHDGSRYNLKPRGY